MLYVLGGNSFDLSSARLKGCFHAANESGS